MSYFLRSRLETQEGLCRGCEDSTNTKMAVGTEEGFVCLFTITEEGLEYLKVLDKQVCAWFRFLDEIVKHSVHSRPHYELERS